jgi:3-dehydroquinate synthase
MRNKGHKRSETRMKELKVRGLKRSYDILIERNSIHQLGEKTAEVIKANKILLLSDRNVYDIYGDIAMQSLEGYGYQVIEYIIEPGESSKSMENFSKILEFMAKYNFTRSDALVALGGGVVGDLGGFVASSYMRGIEWIQCPTSLLAQVDSSVGGKVAVNLSAGKNLVGAFYNPTRVVIDSNTLDTLSDERLLDGLAEVIKYGCIWDEEFFEFLEGGSGIEFVRAESDYIVERCCNIKKEVVETDEFDRGQRMILNFGHTLGHGIEAFYNYESITHGYAVAIGMALITDYTENYLGFTKSGSFERITNILKKYKLPYSEDLEIIRASLDRVKRDKKVINGKLNLILLEKIGKAIYKSCDIEREFWQ